MWNILESCLNDEFIHVLVTLESLVYQTASFHDSPSCSSFHVHVRIICLLCCAVILAKYGMDGKRDTRPLENNYLKDHDTKEGDIFDDPRLDKLWNKVWMCTENEGRKILKNFFIFFILVPGCSWWMRSGAPNVLPKKLFRSWLQGSHSALPVICQGSNYTLVPKSYFLLFSKAYALATLFWTLTGSMQQVREGNRKFYSGSFQNYV